MAANAPIPASASRSAAHDALVGRRGHRPEPTATTDDALALPLGGAAPHPVVLAMADRVLEALLLDRALRAHRLGLVGLLVGGRVEDRGIQSLARGSAHPVTVHAGRFCRLAPCMSK